jgi:Arc/MetJ-type ribon-helix-helix transcriptional regulator
MKVVQVTLEDSVHSTLKEAAKERRVSMAEVIRQALAQWASRRNKRGGVS